MKKVGLLRTDADLGRELHTREASGVEKQSLSKEGGWLGSIQREL